MTELLYTVGAWGELKRYQCCLCPYDTLDGELAILQHIQKRHYPVNESIKSQPRPAGKKKRKARR